eukprot:SAG11_NODE_37793_length_255_cov_0.666667_1_plen_32_part_10
MGVNGRRIYFDEGKYASRLGAIPALGSWVALS